eukprot:Amastigsp_a842093_34.p5 type:complete len:103 gc:universal Amastigsp_a842093_34:985-1293(+)
MPFNLRLARSKWTLQELVVGNQNQSELFDALLRASHAPLTTRFLFPPVRVGRPRMQSVCAASVRVNHGLLGSASGRTTRGAAQSMFLLWITRDEDLDAAPIM